MDFGVAKYWGWGGTSTLQTALHVSTQPYSNRGSLSIRGLHHPLKAWDELCFLQRDSYGNVWPSINTTQSWWVRGCGGEGLSPSPLRQHIINFFLKRNSSLLLKLGSKQKSKEQHDPSSIPMRSPCGAWMLGKQCLFRLKSLLCLWSCSKLDSLWGSTEKEWTCTNHYSNFSDFPFQDNPSLSEDFQFVCDLI